MKKFAKIMLVAGSVLAIGSGAVLSYLYAQPQERPSDLTLANIEALAVPCEEGINTQDKIIVVTVCDRTTGFWDVVFETPCGSPGSGPCAFTNVGKA